MRKSLVPLAAFAAVLNWPAAGAMEDPYAPLWQKLSCTVSSPMKNTPDYRLYSGAYSFDARYIFELKPSGPGTFSGTIVAEKWTSGAQSLIEFSASGNYALDTDGLPTALAVRMGRTRSSGDQKVWPTLGWARIKAGAYGKVWAEAQVGNDVAIGNCRPE